MSHIIQGFKRNEFLLCFIANNFAAFNCNEKNLLPVEIAIETTPKGRDKGLVKHNRTCFISGDDFWLIQDELGR